eukprot:TRINITY_DN3214_c0_g1_i13.p1 TRINITY_DN3214_c0_g1~~TRINITY_DN3214_c0_g1_i13.p1  ORF type:complete len:185 (-),score=17.77 TRINITY_DN3214_c0_g1_i13:132-686(-)
MKRRSGTARTKGRKRVRGGGRKPWPQKYLGRSRQGSIRAPHWRGGGRAFPKRPRSWDYHLNRKVKRQGLICALSARTREQRLIILNTASLSEVKTRLLHKRLQGFFPSYERFSVLIVDTAKDGEDGGKVLRACANNIAGVDVLPVVGLNVYSILQRDYLMVTQNALDLIIERARRPIKRSGRPN